MQNSLSYSIYKALENIYVNSTLVKVFSLIFANLFNIIVNSKVFLMFSNPKLVKAFKHSFIWKMISGTTKIVGNLFDKNFITNTVNNSFFINYTKDILDYKKKDAINNLYLIPILALVINMGIKIAIGSFSVAGNKYFIGILILLITLYSIKLEYWKILKNSKIFRVAYEVVYDEIFDEHI